MTTRRRDWLKGGGLALGAGFLSRVDEVAALQKPPTLAATVKAQSGGGSAKLLLGAQAGEEGPPEPAAYDRLPLEWNKATVKRFKDKLAERDLRAFLVRDPLNITYLTGYWHSTTERPQATFMNADDADPWFLYPSLDRDLVTTWWFGGGRMYFDFLHGEGAFPHQGVVQQGETVDLFTFMLEGIKEHGVQGTRIGIDGELYPSEMEKAKKALPGVEWVNVKDVLIKMRQVKTKEELALWRRAYVYFDRAHAFARDYILTHGTDITDYEVKVATELWINSQLWADLDLAGGKAHHGVSSNVGIGVRAGPVTAYPHPNQPYFNRIGRGMALQVAGAARVGGYGHENYRAFIIADSAGRLRPAHAEALGGQPALLRHAGRAVAGGRDLLLGGLRHPQVPGGAGRAEVHLPPPRPRRRRGGPPVSLPGAGRPHHAPPQHVLLGGARPLRPRARLRLQLERHGGGRVEVGLSHEPRALQQGMVLAEAVSDGKALRDGFVAGEWTVAPSRNLLSRGGEEVRVEPRVMDVLVHLVERAGEVVSREELVERVWEGRYVTDDVLTVTIYALRKALGDQARRPRYLETVSRRGYRWIAPAGAQGVPAGPATPPARRARRRAAAAAVAALAVAGAAWTLVVPRRSRHVPTPESHEAYVKGRYFLDQRSIKGWKQALEQFERAVALDPRSPAAHAGLADAYAAMSDFGVATPAEMRPRAMKAAGDALALDPQSAEGHEALGRAQFLFDWDFQTAERSLERALALDGEHMPAHQAMAWLMSARGRHPEAAVSARRALQLDPVNTARYLELAWVLALGGHYDAALHEVERALQLNPRAAEACFMKGWTLEQAGQPAAAFAAYREGLRLGGAPDEVVRRVEAAYRTGGLAGYYRGWLDARSGGGLPLSDTWRAMVYARVGETDHALQALEQAYRKRESALAWVNVEPSFRPLRSQERFQQIALHVGRPH